MIPQGANIRTVELQGVAKLDDVECWSRTVRQADFEYVGWELSRQAVAMRKIQARDRFRRRGKETILATVSTRSCYLQNSLMGVCLLKVSKAARRPIEIALQR